MHPYGTTTFPLHVYMGGLTSGSHFMYIVSTLKQSHMIYYKSLGVSYFGIVEIGTTVHSQYILQNAHVWTKGATHEDYPDPRVGSDLGSGTPSGIGLETVPKIIKA